MTRVPPPFTFRNSLARPMKRPRWLLALAALFATLALPVAVHAQGVEGVVVWDEVQAPLDRVEVRVSGLGPSPVGQVYWAWLTSQDEERYQLIGPVLPDALGNAVVSFAQPAGENLFGQYNQVVVALGPDEGPGPGPSEAVVLSGRVDPGVLVQGRRLLFRWPDSRYGLGSLVGLRRLADLVQLQAAILRLDVEQGNLEAAQRKAEHLVNLVEGRTGAEAGDWNGDGLVEDPGDGVGVLRYAWGAADQAQIAWAQAVDPAVAEQALELKPSLLFVLDWAGFVRDVGQELARAQTLERAEELSRHLHAATLRIGAGVEPEGDAEVRAEREAYGVSPAFREALEVVRVPLVATTPSESVLGGR